MKLIINTSTLSASGATQVATSFIHECRAFTTHEYHVFLSTTVSQQLNQKDFPANFTFYEFTHHPTSLKGGLKTINKLNRLEQQISPHVVFSVFGPSWWTPKAPHLMGYAYAHYVYPKSPLFQIISLKEKLKIALYKKLHLYFLKRNGQYFVSETTDVSNRLSQLMAQVPKSNFFAVGNTCNGFYFDYKEEGQKKLLPGKTTEEFRFLSLCTYHIHKNLDILNNVITLLNAQNPNENIKFVLTIDQDVFKEKFTAEAQKSIINIGRIPVKQCPQLYAECDALFLPTLLECFSANYPEAMVMEKPIATSDLSFATTVCKDAALYFNPLDALEISETLLRIVNNGELRKHLIEKGKERLQDFPTAAERAKKYLEICEFIKTNE